MFSLPAPQRTSEEEVEDTRNIDLEKGSKKKVTKTKDGKDDSEDLGNAVADIFGGVLGLLNGALDTAEEIAGNEVAFVMVFSILKIILNKKIPKYSSLIFKVIFL